MANTQYNKPIIMHIGLYIGGIKSVMNQLLDHLYRDFSVGVSFGWHPIKDRPGVPSQYSIRDLSWYGKYNLAQYIIKTIQLYFFLISRRPKIIIFHELIPAFTGAWVGKLFGARNILICHSPQRSHSFIKKILFSISSLFLDKIIAVSRHSFNDLLTTYSFAKEKIISIENAVDQKKFSRSNIRKTTIGFSPVITMVSRLDTFSKDPQSLLLAIYLLHNRGYTPTLRFIGDGTERKTLKTMAENLGLNAVVELFGFQEDVVPFLFSTDIFVLSTKWEGLPLSLMEAMFARLPIVATDVCGVNEIIQHNITGLLVPPKEPVKLADAFEHLINNPEQAYVLACAGYKKAQSQFDFKVMIKKYERLVDDLMISHTM